MVVPFSFFPFSGSRPGFRWRACTEERPGRAAIDSRPRHGTISQTVRIRNSFAFSLTLMITKRLAAFHRPTTRRVRDPGTPPCCAEGFGARPLPPRLRYVIPSLTHPGHSISNVGSYVCQHHEVEHGGSSRVASGAGL